MLEKVLALLAAVIVILVAELLVRIQNKRQKTIEELNNKIENDLKRAVNEFESITGQTLTEESLQNLENQLAIFESRINSIQKAPPLKFERRHRYVKRKKNLTDD